MMTHADERLCANGLPIVTVFDDNTHHEHRTWEHNAIAARWSPATGWTYP